MTIGGLLGERVKLEFDEQLLQAAMIRFAYAKLLEVQRDRQILANRYELLRESRVCTLLEKCLSGSFLGNLGCMRENLFERSVAVYQFSRRLVADPANAWHIVRRVADEREIIGDERWWDTESLAPVFGADPLFFDGTRTAATWIQEPDAWSDKLLEVLVAGHDDDIDALRNCLPG
jgi:hypothetical protein